MKRMTSGVLTLTLLLAFSCVPDQGAKPGENAYIRLRTAKNSAEDHVATAKQFSDVRKQEQAKRLYDNANEHYNGYVDGLLHCIREGRYEDLTPSANQASAAAATFTAFVDEHSTTKGIDWVSTAKNLATWALDIYISVHELEIKDRKRYADDLEPQIKWKKWADIN